MNKKPVYYLQTDKRWSSQPYQVSGEKATVGDSGCGPSCAAMLIETITGKTYTPLDACNWSLAHGYKAKGNGTYYAYFKPQFAAFGIDCEMMNWTKTYNNPSHANHTKAVELLKQGYYLIALMGKGLWTGSGHFVVLWWSDNKVRINDPASTKDARLNGDINTFRSQCCYYWWVDARKYNSAAQSSTGTTAAVVHTVKSGDTMSKIAVKYNTTVSALAKLNPQIKNVNMINPGDTVYLTEAAAAIGKLGDLGVLNSPGMWQDCVASGKVQYLDTLMIRAAAKITKAGTRAATMEAGIDALEKAGVINNREYWLSKRTAYSGIEDLIKALGGAVSQ